VRDSFRGFALFSSSGQRLNRRTILHHDNYFDWRRASARVASSLFAHVAGYGYGPTARSLHACSICRRELDRHQGRISFREKTISWADVFSQRNTSAVKTDQPVPRGISYKYRTTGMPFTGHLPDIAAPPPVLLKQGFEHCFRPGGNSYRPAFESPAKKSTRPRSAARSGTPSVPVTRRPFLRAALTPLRSSISNKSACREVAN
jgi:hypothetical protein